MWGARWKCSSTCDSFKAIVRPLVSEVPLERMGEDHRSCEVQDSDYLSPSLQGRCTGGANRLGTVMNRAPKSDQHLSNIALQGFRHMFL